MRTLGIVIGCVGTLLAASVARAETAAVLPTGGDAQLAEARERAVAAVVEALRAQGVQVVAPADAARRLPAALRGCNRTDCADDVARSLGAEIVAGVAVWADEGGEAPASVAVSLITRDSVAYPGSAPVEGGAVDVAARTAVALARDKQRLGPGPWIHVRGSPVGARVAIDGTDAGVLPYRGTITPGQHELAITLAGYVADRRTIDVRMNDQEEVVVDVTLAREGGAGEVTADPVGPSSGASGAVSSSDPIDDGGPRREPSVLNWILAGGLAAAGVTAILARPLPTLVQDGDVVDEGPWGREVVAFGIESALMLGAGLLAIAGGAVIAIFQPFTVEAGVSSTSARLTIEGRF